MKELIKNQEIIIDDHKRGSQEVKRWDYTQDDVHIDKTRAKGVLEKLSKHLELEWTEVYNDANGTEFFLKLVEIGENSGYAKRSKKINR
ncbi:hypothetical protein AGMMS4957_01150 [Bacteroidia bacterium]|nr:hypothetical protein AGMMS4957_01150 [Bacteroidia bacterium]